MEYFKIIYNNSIIGVVTSNQFVRYSPVNLCLLYCSKNKGLYVIYNEKLYRDSWMKPISQLDDCIETEVLKIDEEEYNILYEALKTNEEIEIIETDPEPEPEPIVEPSITVEFMRLSKLNEISYRCKQIIESGFDLELQGEIKHFSLTTQDQLNLMGLSAMAQSQSLIPYHADGEEVIFYTNEEINKIVDAANTFKTYHITYHNALKKYIEALETIEEIGAIEYGTPIPEEYKTNALRILEE